MAQFSKRAQFQDLFQNVIVYTGALNLGNAATGSGTFTSTDITVPGAALGDLVLVSLGIDSVDTVVAGQVSLANTVTVTLLNNTAGAVDLASTTVRIVVLQPSAQLFYV